MLKLYESLRLKPVLILLAFSTRPLLEELIGLFGYLRPKVDLLL